tara:strand:+ start:591 stop:788 length:198 start_codon:yes stop_codon:yes gene_type:complete
MAKNSKKRSVLKTLTWRTFSTSLGVAMIYFYSGSIEFGLTFGVADVIIKSIAYYSHERLWEVSVK